MIETFLQGASPLSVWGAALSTILAGTKAWELWRARVRIEVGYNFNSDENIGNDVMVRNLSGTPLIITYWELIWRQRSLLGWKQSGAIGPEPGEDNDDIKVGAHSSIKLSFRESDHFDWGVSTLGRRKIFLRLHLAGRSKPIWRKVYG